MKSLTAVCIDDSDGEIELIARILAECGIRVVAKARDGESGLRFITRLRPDIATIDIVLGHSTGLAVLEAMRARELATVPIMCTSMRPFKANAIALGAKHFITKPYDDVICGREIQAIVKAEFDG